MQVMCKHYINQTFSSYRRLVRNALICFQGFSSLGSWMQLLARAQAHELEMHSRSHDSLRVTFQIFTQY